MNDNHEIKRLFELCIDKLDRYKFSHPNIYNQMIYIFQAIIKILIYHHFLF